MPILASRSRQVAALLGQLDAVPPAARESALARLTLLGPRVVPTLVSWLPGASEPALLEAMALVECLQDARLAAPLAALFADPRPAVAARALRAAGALPGAESASALAGALATLAPPLRAEAARSLGALLAAGVVEALDPLLGLLFDEGEHDSARLAALDALAALSPAERDPLRRRLAGSASPALRAAALGPDAPRRPPAGEEPAHDALAELEGALRGGGGALPALERAVHAAGAAAAAEALARAGDPAWKTLQAALQPASCTGAAVTALAEALAATGRPAAVPLLHHALRVLPPGPPPGSAEAWARARVHAALGALGSRIALADLRECLERQVRSPDATALLDLAAAAGAVGDPGLAPALGSLWAHHAGGARDACGSALAAIAAREGAPRVRRALRGVPAEVRSALEAILPGPRGAARKL